MYIIKEQLEHLRPDGTFQMEMLLKCLKMYAFSSFIIPVMEYVEAYESGWKRA